MKNPGKGGLVPTFKQPSSSASVKISPMVAWTCLFCLQNRQLVMSPVAIFCLSGIPMTPDASSSCPKHRGAVMTSTAAREKQALRQQCGGTLPEQPSAIEKDAGGEIPPGLLGVPQWTRTSSAGQEYNCMSHHSVSFTQCQRRLPFEILTSSQKGPGSNIHAVCHGQSAPSSDPQPTF